MSDWKTIVAQVANNVEEHYDALKLRLREKLGIGPVQILPYLGHGTRRTLHLQGRAVAGYDVTSAHDNDTLWQNLLNMYQRFDSHEIPHALVQARFGEIEQQVRADEEGYFEVEFRLDQPLPADRITFEIDLELVEYADQECARETGRVIVPPPGAQFGVISDLDDTVIRTDVTHLLKLARNTFLNNSRTRLPFPGVAEFYHALQKGQPPTYNPIFYVSNSPWNLYDLIVDFFEVRGIPLGPFSLLDLGTTAEHLIRPDPIESKLARIRHVLEAHPELPFLLIGDSGEDDPEIYLRTVLDFPGRIRAVYIRDVSPDERDQGVVKLVEEAKRAGTEMLLVPDTVGAALHAAERGWIAPDALPAVRQERREDKREPEGVEKLIDALP